MTDLSIFSYLPNPRLWKASIVARLCGVDLEIRGTSPGQLADWLWDIEARPLEPGEKSELSAIARNGRVGLTTTLYKTEAFMAAHPFGNVPAGFAPDGTGIFESNSIMRAVARLGGGRCQLYGDDPYIASRIDSFLDVTLMFAREIQIYVLALWGNRLDATVHDNAIQGFRAYFGGIEQALAADRTFLVGDGLTLADIAFFAELALLHNEYRHADQITRLGLQPFLCDETASAYPRSVAHFEKLRRHEAFVPDAEDYLGQFPEITKTR